ncbi:glucokinase [Simiduia aestuariiviva]|uniref:Glucokinase n=1 Tax=Simiduia aestuariiviva TaxID=1510459 RepID=A0A839UMK9_9GAMM|nr:glucokinase [Simiduia aestuariiviva]MBB3168001.1 glucokinase [Simiduia aestuariiviva]
MSALATVNSPLAQTDVFPYVVADIGGTNARWGLVTGVDSAGNYNIEAIQTFENTLHPKFEDSLAAYLDSLRGVEVARVCVALAGPVLGDQIEMTNINWSFSIRAVEKAFSLRKLLIVNDFTALAYATSALSEADVIRVKLGTQKNAPRAIIGPGTGLGMASLVPLAGRWLPLSGEGGHTAFAPRGAEELALCEHLQREIGYVSKETLLSGAGIERIFTGLAAVRGLTVAPMSAAEISGMAARKEDSLAVDTLNLFCGVMGSAAADLALTVGALGGVYLGGGILPKVREFFLQSPFVARFCEKAVMSHYVEDIPVFLIVADEPALIGAAALLAEHS